MTTLTAQAAGDALNYGVSDAELGMRGFQERVIDKVNRIRGGILILDLYLYVACATRSKRKRLIDLVKRIERCEFETDEDREFAMNAARRLMTIYKSDVKAYEDVTNHRVWRNYRLLRHLEGPWWETIEMTEDLAETLALRASKDFIEWLEAEVREHT